VRTDGPPAATLPIFRAAIKRVDADIPLYKVRSMTELIGDTLSTQRLTNILLTAFAVVALLLAAVGIYGVMAFAVTQRTQEIGIRMALGARALDVLKLVLRNGMSLAAIGAVIGLAGAFVITRFMSSLLFEVSPTDMLTFALVTMGLLLVAVFACYIPARRATKVDPLVALRYE